MIISRCLSSLRMGNGSSTVRRCACSASGVGSIPFRTLMSRWSDKLVQLANALPREGDVSDLDVEARFVLRHLLICTPSSLDAKNKFEETTAALCPNCGTPTPSKSSPYCSPFCREEAAFIRQFRAGITSGAALDPDRQANFGQNLWHLLGGGFPRRVALIKPKELAKTLARGCEMCGAEAVTVDHTGSG